MNLSLNELESLCRKAARGAGFGWGAAEEAGRAARWLASFGLPGPDLLLARLARFDGPGEGGRPCGGGNLPVQALSPRSLDGDWRSAGDTLCPIHAGAALSDTAERVAERGELTLHEVLCPLLLAPFAALVARQVGRPVSIGWADLLVTCDGDAPWLNGTRSHAADELADAVRCVVSIDTGAAQGTELGERAARVTRATPGTDVVAALEGFAQRTYAPATEESRQRGAGGASTGDG